MPIKQHYGKAMWFLIHFPTIVLSVGYVLFWILLFFIPTLWQVPATAAVSILVLLIVIFQLVSLRNTIDGYALETWRWIKSLSAPLKAYIFLGSLLVFIYLACAAYASFLPVHLIQENDALNYHITLPRQHLLTHSFAHLKWSTVDLFTLPLDFALAPFWLLTTWPNKAIQFVFLLGLGLMSFRIGLHLSHQNRLCAFTALFAVLALHMVGIQAGTAMMDLTLAYCFLAFIDSLLSGLWLLAALELSFYVFAKPLIPFQTLCVGLVVAGLCWLLMKKGFQLHFGFQSSLLPRIPKLKFILSFVLLSVMIAGPFIAKSIQKSGVPFFPAGVGVINLNPSLDHDTVEYKAIVKAADAWMTIKDDYGYGHGLGAWLKHFWLIAVPQKGSVNNRYDYPVGLIYVLCIGPFFWFTIQSLRNKQIPLLALIALGLWASWWVGSHQSRFLMVPIILLIMCTCSNIKRISAVWTSVVILALSMTTLSVVRAHHQDWGKQPLALIRTKDKELMQLPLKPSPAVLDFYDAAYAPVVIDVRGYNRYFILDLS